MVVRISGRVAVYEDRISLILIRKGFKILQIGQYDYERFMAVTTKDIPRMYDDLLSLVGRMRMTILELCSKISSRTTKFIEKFIVSPAASKVHHAYKGGLLEHNVCRRAMRILRDEVRRLR